MLRGWYRIVAQADPLVAEIYIYDEIGKSFWNDEAVGAKQFIDDLAALSAAVTTLRVHVNSPGGDPFDAITIANALRAQSRDKGRKVLVSIDGLAASAATIISCAGDSIEMADNALMLIHQPSGDLRVTGTAADMRQAADALASALDRITVAFITTYQWVSKLSADALGAMMAKETWMTAEEAVTSGFATEIVSGIKARACFRPEAIGRLGEIPEAYQAVIAALIERPAQEPVPDPAPAPPPEPTAADPVEVLRACNAAGVPELAEELVTAKAPLERVHARVAAAKEVLGLCLTARLPELAADYVKAGTPAAVVRRQLTALTARLDASEIDGHLRPDAGVPKARVLLSPTEIYAARNQRALPTGKGA